MISLQAHYIGLQEYPGHAALELWNLEEDIPGHPVGSTMSRHTLNVYGYEPQEAT